MLREKIGGILYIDSAPSRGTTVRADAPLEATEPKSAATEPSIDGPAKPSIEAA